MPSEVRPIFRIGYENGNIFTWKNVEFVQSSSLRYIEQTYLSCSYQNLHFLSPNYGKTCTRNTIKHSIFTNLDIVTQFLYLRFCKLNSMIKLVFRYVNQLNFSDLRCFPSRCSVHFSGRWFMHFGDKKCNFWYFNYKHDWQNSIYPRGILHEFCSFITKTWVFFRNTCDRWILSK